MEGPGVGGEVEGITTDPMTSGVRPEAIEGTGGDSKPSKSIRNTKKRRLDTLNYVQDSKQRRELGNAVIDELRDQATLMAGEGLGEVMSVIRLDGDAQFRVVKTPGFGGVDLNMIYRECAKAQMNFNTEANKLLSYPKDFHDAALELT